MRVVLAVIAALVLAPSAHASGWSTPRIFSAGRDADWEPAPRAAISADGTSLVAWSADRGRLMATGGDRRGRFSSPVTVARATFDHAVAAGAIAYETRGGVYVA